MELDSVKELQEEANQFIEQNCVSKQSLSSKNIELFIPPATGIYINGKNDYKLAVHLQNEKLIDFIEPLKEKAHNEIDVQVTGIIQKQCLWRIRHRPLRLGVSISHYNSLDVGSLGCFVRKRNQSDLLILSNNHVLANENDARKGDAIIQPGCGGGDNGDLLTDQIGVLEEFIEIKRNQLNLVDVALAKVENNLVDSLSFLEHGYSLQGAYKEIITEKIPTVKVGRTTGLTRGTMTTFNMTMKVNYGTPTEQRFYQFAGVTAIEGSEGAFSQPGDSGSLIVDENGYAVALLFAGSEHGSSNGCGFTYAIPINTVCQELDIELAY